MNRLLTILLLASATAGCCCIGKKKAELEEVRYCKYGISLTETTPGQYVEEPVRTDIRTPDWYLLISASDSNFRIYRSHCTAGNIQPPWQKICIEKGDAVTINEYGDIYKLSLMRSGVQIAGADMKLVGPDNLWLEGEAVLANPPQGQDPRVGKFFLYARPMERPCRYSVNSTNECRSVFVEYFAYGDSHSAKYVPTTAGPDPTVTRGICPTPPVGAETGDGEGDHGPLKP